MSPLIYEFIDELLIAVNRAWGSQTCLAPSTWSIRGIALFFYFCEFLDFFIFHFLFFLLPDRLSPAYFSIICLIQAHAFWNHSIQIVRFASIYIQRPIIWNMRQTCSSSYEFSYINFLIFQGTIIRVIKDTSTWRKNSSVPFNAYIHS